MRRIKYSSQKYFVEYVSTTFQNSKQFWKDVDVRNLRMTLIFIPHGLCIQLSALPCIVMT